MKASVIIPNLNGAGWLRDSIESVWAQTEQDFELIVIDNGSKDESLEIARSYRGRDRYTLIENAENTGFSHAVNQGIAIAKGEYAVRWRTVNMWCCSTTMPLPSRTGWRSLSGPLTPTRRFLPSAA